MAKGTLAGLSERLCKVWGGLEIRHLVLGSDEFIVYLDDVLDIEWKTTAEWDSVNPKDPVRHRAIIIKAAALEAGDWDYSDEKRTLSLRRQIAEAIACSLEGDYENGEKMLEVAAEYRNGVLRAREDAIADQVHLKGRWKQHYRTWTGIHYAIGITALFFSTLVASKPALLAFDENVFSFFAWLVAFLTALLTFLTPDKKAGKYLRAWSILNGHITRYRTDKSYLLESVLAAHQQAENIIFESSDAATMRQHATRRKGH